MLCSISQPTPNQNIPAFPYTTQGTSSPTAMGQWITSIQWDYDGGPLNQPGPNLVWPSPQNNWSWSFSLQTGPTPAGNHTLNLHITDSGGNMCQPSVPFTS
jgi:hypothetical protein